MLGYLPLDIICSSKLTVRLSEQIMSADKYPIFSRQMEAIVYVDVASYVGRKSEVKKC